MLTMFQLVTGMIPQHGAFTSTADIVSCSSMCGVLSQRVPRCYCTRPD